MLSIHFSFLLQNGNYQLQSIKFETWSRLADSPVGFLYFHSVSYPPIGGPPSAPSHQRTSKWFSLFWRPSLNIWHNLGPQVLRLTHSMKSLIVYLQSIIKHLKSGHFPDMCTTWVWSHFQRIKTRIQGAQIRSDNTKSLVCVTSPSIV